MSRSGYSDDYDTWSYIMWRGAVSSATRGKRKRGQKLLKDLALAMDAMEVKELIDSELEGENGSVCALGCLGKAKGIDMSNIDPEDPDQVSLVFDIAPALAREIVYINDEASLWSDNPSKRWTRVREWIRQQIK